MKERELYDKLDELLCDFFQDNKVDFVTANNILRNWMIKTEQSFLRQYIDQILAEYFPAQKQDKKDECYK